MKKNILYLTVMFLIINSLSMARIIHIPENYSTIQEGIDASENGDTVLVQPGTYEENIDFNGHNILLCSMYQPTREASYISSTIIDGNSSGIVVTIDDNEDSNAVITGFTIQNGRAALSAGIYCESSSPIISDNIIKNNTADL